MSQQIAILNHLKRYGGITPLEALERYQCFRLAARINDLRGVGHRIETKIINKNDKKFAQYELRGEKREMVSTPGQGEQGHQAEKGVDEVWG